MVFPMLIHWKWFICWIELSFPNLGVSLLCQVSDIRCLMSDFCYQTSEFRRLMWDVWCQTSDIVWCQVSDNRCLISDIWWQISVKKVWHLILDICYKTSVIRHLISDAWRLMPDFGYQTSDVWFQLSAVTRLMSNV